MLGGQIVTEYEGQARPKTYYSYGLCDWPHEYHQSPNERSECRTHSEAVFVAYCCALVIRPILLALCNAPEIRHLKQA